MTDIDDTAIESAAAWHARLDSPDMDWAAFGTWLDAAPDHRRAYDAIALLDAEIGDAAPALAALLPANDDQPTESSSATTTSRAKRWRWATFGASGALAAGLAFMMVAPSTDGGPQIYTTGRSETRAVTLADGSRMRIDRGSSLSVTGGGTPVIDIAQGAASFAVRHDPARTLMVRAGGFVIRDVGTRFDVVSTPGRVSVTVAEGAVSVSPVEGAAEDATMLRAKAISGASSPSAAPAMSTAALSMAFLLNPPIRPGSLIPMSVSSLVHGIRQGNDEIKRCRVLGHTQRAGGGDRRRVWRRGRATAPPA